MKTDETQLTIANSFKSLCQNYPFNKISIHDITLHAGINRSTFYYYFEDKNALIHWIFQNDITDCFITALPEEWIYNARHLLSVFHRDFAFYKKIIQINEYSYLYRLLFHMTNQTSIEFMNAYLNTSFEGTALPPEYFSFLQHFYSHAYAGMLIQYIQNGAAENPEAAAQRFFAISEYGMKSAIDQFLHYKQNGQSLMITGTQSAAYRQTCEPLSIQEQIAVSFKKLCCTKSIQKISVASITDASHVNRSTYYYYFKNKEELISFIFKHDISSHMIPASPNFWIYNTRHFLEILQQDISFYSQIAKSDYIHTLRTLILENTAERTREYFDYCCQKLSVTEEDRQFFIYFYAYAFTGMYIEYIENNASIPFERYTEYFYYVSEPACRLSIEALVSLNKTTALPNSI